MTYKHLQAACYASKKLLSIRSLFIAFGVIDKNLHFHPTGHLFTNEVDTEAYACLMSALSECVEKLFGRACMMLFKKN